MYSYCSPEHGFNVLGTSSQKWKNKCCGFKGVAKVLKRN
jgi:hypothetical protein